MKREPSVRLKKEGLSDVERGDDNRNNYNDGCGGEKGAAKKPKVGDEER